jgi:hypothetical protein
MSAAFRIVLVGGPEGVADKCSPMETTSLDGKVKVPFASGYEHFSHSGRFTVVDGDSRPVFEWCDRTRIAE